MPNIKDIMKTAAGWAKNNAYRFDPNINRRTVSWQETKDALREFGKSDSGKEFAMGLTAATPAITGGNHMLAGDGLMGLGAIAGTINPFLGVAVTAGGALMNAAFGSNVNQGAIKGYEDRLVDYSRPEITAQDNTQLLNQINGLKSFGTVKRSDLGTQGWFNHDVDYAYNNLVQGVNAANASRARLVDDAVTNVEKQNDARIAMNYRAFGGPIFGYMSDGAIAYDMARDNLMAKLWNAQNKSQGQSVNTSFAAGGLLSDNFTNGVTEVNAGGTHEENPYSGVPMGMAEDGQPNLVEEGEAIYNDYVFSNRLKVPKAIRSKYKLRGPKDMTYAEAFLKAQEESEERENDPISKNGLDYIASVLAQSQEEVKAKKESRKKAQGGHLFATGSAFDVPPFDMGSMTPEEFYRINQYWPEGYNPTTGQWDSPASVVDAGSAPVVSSSTGAPATTTPPPAGVEGVSLLSNSVNPLRLAPIAGNMYAVWSDATGKTNNPVTYDYIPNYAPLGFTPIGEYMPELHMDTRYAANQQAQQAAATRNAIMNTTSPSRMASLLAADYNAQNNYGTLLRDAAIADYDNMLKARTFNRATNQYNSEMSAKIAADNAQQRLAYAQAQLAEAKANTDETNVTMGAKGQNIRALTTSLGNLGKELNSRDMIKWLTVKGVLGNYSEADLRGMGVDESVIKEIKGDKYVGKETKSHGGKLRKKRGGFTY